MNIFQTKAQIMGNEKLTGKHYKLKLAEDAGIVDNARPGQFLHISCQPGKDREPFRYRVIDSFQQLKHSPNNAKENLLILRRPFSIHRAYTQDEQKVIEILFKVVGKGTELLAQKNIGEELDIIGPIGQGFRINPGLKNAILVAGGVGIAPLYALAERLSRQEKNVYMLVGALDKESIPLSFQDIRAEVKIATAKKEQGSYHGLVTEMLVDFLGKNQNLSDQEIFACGPWAMLKEVDRITAEQAIPCQVLLEERMACGIGACMACVCKTVKKGYSRVCIDGPVFKSNEVVWE